LSAESEITPAKASGLRELEIKLHLRRLELVMEARERAHKGA
jgi:hypothetical protein